MYYWRNELQHSCSFSHSTDFEESNYQNNRKYWDRQAFANSVDPEQMPQNVESDQGLHYLPYIQQYFRHIKR